MSKSVVCRSLKFSVFQEKTTYLLQQTVTHTKYTHNSFERNIWVKVFKNGPIKICGRRLSKIWSDMVYLSRRYHFKFFKGCLPQNFLGPFLNTLTHIPVDMPYGSREYQKRNQVPREYLRWRALQQQLTTFSRCRCLWESWLRFWTLCHRTLNNSQTSFWITSILCCDLTYGCGIFTIRSLIYSIV